MKLVVKVCSFRQKRDVFGILAVSAVMHGQALRTRAVELRTAPWLLKQLPKNNWQLSLLLLKLVLLYYIHVAIVLCNDKLISEEIIIFLFKVQVLARELVAWPDLYMPGFYIRRWGGRGHGDFWGIKAQFRFALCSNTSF